MFVGQTQAPSLFRNKEDKLVQRLVSGLVSDNFFPTYSVIWTDSCFCAGMPVSFSDPEPITGLGSLSEVGFLSKDETLA